MDKIHNNDTILFDSRSCKIEQRFEEFISNPIWSVCFSAIDTNEKNHYSNKTGMVELGPS